jgi:hypothetical protein
MPSRRYQAGVSLRKPFYALYQMTRVLRLANDLHWYYDSGLPRHGCLLPTYPRSYWIPGIVTRPRPFPSINATQMIISRRKDGSNVVLIDEHWTWRSGPVPRCIISQETTDLRMKPCFLGRINQLRTPHELLCLRSSSKNFCASKQALLSGRPCERLCLGTVEGQQRRRGLSGAVGRRHACTRAVDRNTMQYATGIRGS